jgi:hypothetical protein
MKEYFTTEYLTKIWEMIAKWAIYELPVIYRSCTGDHNHSS